MEQTLPSKRLLVVILLEGFVSIACEILTIRQLLAFAGGSVIVTSIIIGVFLLALALGYHRGGRCQNNLCTVLRRNFVIASIGMGIGLSYPFIYFFFYLFQQIFHSLIFFPLSCYLIMVTAPTVFCLGFTLPIAMRLLDTGQNGGEIGGKVLALSTVGSFLGATLTSVLFMQHIGVAWTITLDTIILLSLCLLLPRQHNNHFSWIWVFIPILLIAVYYCNVVFEHYYFKATNSYANYQVHTNHKTGNKEFNVNNGASSLLTLNHNGHAYLNYVRNLLFNQLKLRHQNILVIGAGGFTLTAKGDYQNHITYVDIDPQIKDIAQRNFIKNIPAKFIAQDARAFLRSHQQHYRIIFSDVYSNNNSIPTYLLTRQYFLAIKKHLANNGLAIFNIIAHANLNDAYSKRVYNTIMTSFGNCLVTPVPYRAQKPTNLVFICHQTTHLSDQAVYTDNINSAASDYFFSKNALYW